MVNILDNKSYDLSPQKKSYLMREITPEQRKNLNAWVEALRSGKFTQGFSRLVSHQKHLNISYCCLGIAGRVIGLNDLELESQLPKGGQDREKGTFLEKTAAAQFGLTFEDQQQLAHMNDNGKSLMQIADAIVKMFNL